MAGGAGGGSGGSGEYKTDQREIVNDFRELIEAALDARQARILTAIPVKFGKFDKEKQTSVITPLIKTTVRKPDGQIERRDFPEIKDAPVYFPSGGREEQNSQGQRADGSQAKKGYMMTVPIQEGDEGIGIISCRTLDFWHEEGGEQKQGTARMHDPSDMMVLPGMKSKPRAEEVKGGVNDKAAQFRSVDGKHSYGVDEDGENGGLQNNTEAHIKSKATKNVETTAGEDLNNTSKNTNNKIEQVHTTQAGKGIVKTAPKILWNS